MLISWYFKVKKGFIEGQQTILHTCAMCADKDTGSSSDIRSPVILR